MPVTPRGFGLGLIPDRQDDRDRRYGVSLDRLPEHVDLSTDPAMPPIWDQGQLGSCTAHGTLACFLWASAKCGANDPMLSRLQLYWNTRALEGTVDQDSGGMIRDAIKATTQGIAPESDWPYDITKFTEPPPARAQKDAADNIGLTYARVEQSEQGIRSCLADGFPVDIGITLYQSFESEETMTSGVASMPLSSDGQPIGGHCLAVVGYGPAEFWQENGYPAARANTEYAKIRNSWGLVYQGGTTGNFLLPLEYLTDPNLGQDYWTLRRVS